MGNGYPDLQIFDYVEEGDFFVVTKEYQAIADKLGLTEWNSVAWIGRLIALDNDYGEHWFDNWKEREEKVEIATKLGFEIGEILIVDPNRFQDGKDGPCHTNEFRKTFWTDILRTLKINLSTIIKKAIQENEKEKTIDIKEYDYQLDEKINEVLVDYGLEKPNAKPKEKDKNSIFTAQQISEISQEILAGLKCYINKTTDEIKVTFDSDSPYFDLDALEKEDKEEIEELEANWRNYVEIKPMPSRVSYQVMEDFVNEVKDRKLKERLIIVLNRKKPFQNFKFEIDNSNYRERWFEFRNEAYYEWVEDQIKDYEIGKKERENE